MQASAAAITRDNGLELAEGSRVGVVGGGPAGSFFALFLLQLAARLELNLEVEIFEPRNFEGVGPQSCNMCGGIISESLVQNLAAEGIRLPPEIIQRSLDSYRLHADVGDVCIATPKQEKRIAAVHRGCGPRDLKQVTIQSFDGYLLRQALGQGACHRRARVTAIGSRDGKLYVRSQNREEHLYDLVAVATGINAPAIQYCDAVAPGYAPPVKTKTHIAEACFAGREMVKRYLGSSMHVFLLDIPHLEFAAIIPKGEYATVCLLGEKISNELVGRFLETPEVRACLPPGWQQGPEHCHCSPKINVSAARQPFADRLVFIGDCGATRLYKDGIGAAYRTAKAAAATAVFQGIAAADFRRHYLPVCQGISRDNQLGRFIFAVTSIIRRHKFLRRGVLRMVEREQKSAGGQQPMSSILWNTFTGSAPYRDILFEVFHPRFLFAFAWNIAAANLGNRRNHP